MSRFERQATEGGDLPALLGSATEEFRRSLERHVQQIVDAAKEQAAEIEREAHRNAKEKEQQLDVRSQELVQGVVNRAASVLDSIELVQTAISGMLAELRTEVKALESGASAAGSKEPSARPTALIGTDQRQAKEASSAPRQARVEAPKPPAKERIESPQPPPAATAPAPPPVPVAIKPASVPAPPKPEAPSQVEPGPLAEQASDNKAGASRVSDSSAEFDQMIHGEIRRMFQSGKSREDVEGFLARFELGDSYDGLLNELYSQKDPSGRRRIFGRRRDR